ncbi:hypothetical protein LTR10_010380 [Elasticomyces elasticus]|nr:hypothetical protein LTR10_010380 [Elasticomyces elasticus]KAK4972282.1 hypothetical protein LTR42_006789 [Elasticomyces elasticus]
MDGTTLYENRAYFSYVGASARNSCGQVGKTHRSGVVAVPSSDVYSVSGYHYDWEAAAHSFNFADLNPPVPASAFFMQQWCEESDGYGANLSLYNYRVNGVGRLAGLCQEQVIYDGSYNPMIALPPQFRALDPAWSQCLLQLGGLYDPPKPLQQATSLDAPTMPAPVSTATTPATPAQTASPATVIATATSPEVSQTESSISQSIRPSSKNSDTAAATSQGGDGESAEAEQRTSTLAVSSTGPTLTNGGPSTSEIPPTNEPGTSETQGSNAGLSDGDSVRLSTTDVQNTVVSGPLDGSSDQTTAPATPTSQAMASVTQDQQESSTDPLSQLAGTSFESSSLTAGLGAIIVSVINGASTMEDQPPPTASSSQSVLSGDVGTFQGHGGSSTLTLQPGEIAQTPHSAEGASSSSSGESDNDSGRSTTSADEDQSSGPAATGGGSEPDQTTSSPSADPGGLIVSVMTGASAVQVQSSSDVRSPQPSLGSATVSQASSLDSEITATSGTAIISTVHGSPTENPSFGGSDPGSNNPSSVDSASSLKNAPGSAFTTMTTPVAVITVGSAILTVQQSQAITVGDQTITPGGSAAIVSGNKISIGASGVVVGGTAVDFQPSILVPASAISAQVGTTDVGGSSFDASLLGSFLILGSQTLTVGGSAITLSGGATASAGSSGNLVLGGSQTVKIGSDLSSVVLTANGQTITAIPASGDPRAAVVDSSATLSQDGSAHVVDGLTLSLGRSGIVVNGADTVTLPTQIAMPQSATLTIDGQLYTVSQATPSIDAVDGSEVLTAEDSAKTLPNGESVSATPPVILIDGSTFRIGTANTPLVTEMQGHLHTFSELSPGLQVVDGSITLEAGAAATTLSNGEVLSAVSGGAVVDGTSIYVPAQYTAMTTSIDGHAYTISRGAVGVYAINGVTVPVDGMPTTLPDGAVLSVGTSLGSPTISMSQSEQLSSSPTGVATTTASTTREGGAGSSRCGRMFHISLMAIWAAIALC